MEHGDIKSAEIDYRATLDSVHCIGAIAEDIFNHLSLMSVGGDKTSELLANSVHALQAQVYKAEHVLDRISLGQEF